MKKYQLNITFRESEIEDWGTPEGKSWNDVLKKAAEGLDDNCTLGEVKSYALSEIFPKFDEKLVNIVENITKDTNLYQCNDFGDVWYDTIYRYIYDLDNSISEEVLGELRDELADELTSVDSIYVEELES